MPLARTSRPVLPAINLHEPCRRATGAVAPAASVAHGLHHAKIMLLALTAKQLAVFVPRRLPKGRGRAVRECPGGRHSRRGQAPRVVAAALRRAGLGHAMLETNIDKWARRPPAVANWPVLACKTAPATLPNGPFRRAKRHPPASPWRRGGLAANKKNATQRGHPTNIGGFLGVRELGSKGVKTIVFDCLPATPYQCSQRFHVSKTIVCTPVSCLPSPK